MKTTFKDWPKIYRRIRRMRGLRMEEKVLLAQGLAATPQERWSMHDQFLRSFGLSSHWERKKLGFKLQEWPPPFSRV
jgi:hypothetical protein